MDEVQTVSFTDVDEMRGALKGYMENGKYTVGKHEGAADAGIILLGNISSSLMTGDVRENVFQAGGSSLFKGTDPRIFEGMGLAPHERRPEN